MTAATGRATLLTERTTAKGSWILRLRHRKHLAVRGGLPRWISAWTVGASLIALSAGASVPARALDLDATFMAAREAFQKGQIERLNRLATDLSDYPLYPYVSYWQLRSRLPDAPGSDIQGMLTQQGDTLAGQRLRADWLKQLGKAKDWETFEREYRGFALEDPELTCYALQARVARDDQAALQEARPLWYQGTAQPDSCAPLFDALINRGQLTQEDVWARVRMALESSNVSFAKSLMAYLPAGQRINPRDLEAVARLPQRYLERRPVPLKSRAERELAMFATYRLATNLPAVAATRLEKYTDLLPAEDRAYVWGQVATAGALKQRPEATDWFKRAGESRLSDRQLAWKARTGLRNGEWQLVDSAIGAMSERERQLPVWRYWKARALIALDRVPEGNALLAPLSFEHNFYGQLANEELGTALSATPDTFRPSLDEIATVERAPGIQRALKFYQLGLRYEGALEWRWCTRAFDDRQLLAAAEVARRAGWYERAIDSAERTQQLHDFALRFPTPYREVVNGYSRQLDLDEAWVYGLVRQESRFVVDARSSAGAQGLMQLMPATARQVARRLGLPGFGGQHVTSVETNINLGTYHLRQLLDSLDNQTLLASAAYNAGAGRARDWRAEKPLEGAIYAESIPFSETRDYVRKVMNNTMFYARQFGSQYISLKQRLGVVGPRLPANE